MHILSKEGAVAATMIFAMVGVVISAAGGMGWEDVGFLAPVVFNFDMFSYFLFVFLLWDWYWGVLFAAWYVCGPWLGVNYIRGVRVA